MKAKSDDSFIINPKKMTEGRHKNSKIEGGADAELKKSAETKVNVALSGLKESILAVKVKKDEETIRNMRRCADIFIKSLDEVPLSFKGLTIAVKPLDSHYAEIMREKMHIEPDENGVYSMPIPTPRRIRSFDSDAAWGSEVRDQVLFKQGEIKTLKLGTRIDRETGCDVAIEINPTNTGSFSVEKRLGMYRFFPREIMNITVQEGSPAYLTEDERRFVESYGRS